MPILSENPLWETFGLRALALAVYGGADFGECSSTVDRIGGGNKGDWYREWTGTAERIFATARACEEGGHRVSAREAYHRASTYYHVAYFPLFGHPVDLRLVDAFDRETDAFLRAARLSDFPVEPVELPFEGGSLPAYFLRPTSEPLRRPTILHVNGYDGDIQEMYFAHGPAALRRGYNCFLLDGPGQGRNLIRDGIPIRPDWETVVRPAVDYLLSRPEVDPGRIVLAGWSFGGFLAPRAAAFESRIAALIADPGLWDQRPDLNAFHVPPAVIRDFPDVAPEAFTPIEMRFRAPGADPMLQWKIFQRGYWVHGVETLGGLLRELNRFEISSVAHQISCPTLLTASEGDVLSAQTATLYAALRCPKQMIQFTAAEGAEGHCESLARTLYHQRVFDWLDGILA